MDGKRYVRRNKDSASVRFLMTLICIIAVIMVTVYFIGAQFRPETDGTTKDKENSLINAEPDFPNELSTGQSKPADETDPPEDENFKVYITFNSSQPEPTPPGDETDDETDTGNSGSSGVDSPIESGEGSMTDTDPVTDNTDLPDEPSADIPVELEHEHDWEISCTEPAVCKRCGIKGLPAPGHDFSAATCTAPETCSRCGETRGEASGHKWVDATCKSPKTCSVCGKESGEALGHKWKSATCQAPETCSRCGETRGDVAEHDWESATCTKPKTCSVCGKESGEELGHKWNDATCTTPETCSRCGRTRGEAAGHKWTEATTTSPSKCSVCGLEKGDRLPNPIKVSAFDYTEEEYMMLARLVYVEAGSRSYDGMRAVATVVLNRVRSSGFGSTIKAVITAPGQFATGDLSNINPPAICFDAIDECLAGNLYDSEILYFKASSTGKSWGNRTFCFTVGDNNFYT